MYEAVAVELAGMPEMASLRRVSTGGETIVSFGSRLVFRYQDDDTGLRNLAIVALTDAGVEGLEVAKVFGCIHSEPRLTRGSCREMVAGDGVGRDPQGPRRHLGRDGSGSGMAG